MLLKQQYREQWQGAGISSGNWGVCQEACSPAGGPSAPTPHLSSKHTQLAPPLLQCAPARSCSRIFSHPWTLQAFVHPPHSPTPSPTPELASVACRSIRAENAEAWDRDETVLLETLRQSFGPKGEPELWGAPCLITPLVLWLETGQTQITFVFMPPQTFRDLSLDRFGRFQVTFTLGDFPESRVED